MKVREQDNRIWVVGEGLWPLCEGRGSPRAVRVLHESLVGGVAGGEIFQDAGAAVVWSGCLRDEETGDVDPRTWTEVGWRALDAAMAEVVARGGRVVVRAQAGDVVSDVLSCARFLSAYGDRGCAILYDPAGMMSAAMREGPSAPDLLRRFFEATGEGALGEQAARGGLLGVVVGEDELSAKLAASIPAFVRLIVPESSAERVFQALRLAGVSTTLGPLPTRGKP